MASLMPHPCTIRRGDVGGLLEVGEALAELRWPKTIFSATRPHHRLADRVSKYSFEAVLASHHGSIKKALSEGELEETLYVS